MKTAKQKCCESCLHLRQSAVSYRSHDSSLLMAPVAHRRAPGRGRSGVALLVYVHSATSLQKLRCRDSSRPDRLRGVQGGRGAQPGGPAALTHGRRFMPKPKPSLTKTTATAARQIETVLADVTKLNAEHDVMTALHREYNRVAEADRLRHEVRRWIDKRVEKRVSPHIDTGLNLARAAAMVIEAHHRKPFARRAK